MREFIRPAATVLGIACLAASFSYLPADRALAQNNAAPAQAAPAPGQPPQLKQIALTEKQIQGVLSAQKDFDAVMAKLPQDAAPDAKAVTLLDGVARKNGFASYDDYNNVMDNIALVLSGFDPATKKYVGSDAVIKEQIAQVQADTKMSAKDKKQALDDLNTALKSPAPAIQNKGNIDLVGKYYDKLVALMGDDQN